MNKKVRSMLHQTEFYVFCIIIAFALIIQMRSGQFFTSNNLMDLVPSFTKSRMAAVPFRGENRHVLRNGPPDSNGFIIPRNAALILRMVIIGQLSIKNQACRILVPERGRFSGSISLARSAHPPKGYGFIGCPFL